MNIKLKKSFKKKLEKLNKKDQEYVIKALKEIQENKSSKKIKKLSNRNEFSLRIGQYRCLFLKEDDFLVFIDLGLRSKIYQIFSLF